MKTVSAILTIYCLDSEDAEDTVGQHNAHFVHAHVHTCNAINSLSCES